MDEGALSRFRCARGRLRGRSRQQARLLRGRSSVHRPGTDAVHRLSTGVHSLPVFPLDPPRDTCNRASCYRHVIRRYDDEV